MGPLIRGASRADFDWEQNRQNWKLGAESRADNMSALAVFPLP